MEKGKRICRTLKELRKRIADANEIPYEIEECPHKGECPGTCPKCESDVHYLMNAIDNREQQGKPVVIEGLMSEDELRQVFSIEPVNSETLEEFVTVGMPALNESETITVAETGIIPEQLMGEPMSYSSYDFAATIAKELFVKNDGNFVFSPAGLCCMLEMLRDGMDEKSNIYHEVNKLITNFNCSIYPYDCEDFKLEHAASIWYNMKLGVIKEDYLKTIEDEYGAEAHNANFHQKTKTKLWIDKWVSDNTNQMINKLDTELSEDALMLVLDAIYLNGKWENPFDLDFTELDTFHNSDGTESEVAMMSQEIEGAKYEETDEYQVINLPYKNSEYSMVLTLPKGDRCIESVMSNTGWLDIDLEDSDVQLYMPRFSFDNTFSFKDILSELGLKDIFESDDSLPYITDKPAYISEIKQQCVIKVEEEGTEAAVVTMAECEVGCPPPFDMSQIITMVLNKPFGFAIKGELGQMLFMGVVKNMDGKAL